MSSDERKSARNGIHLCQTCAKRVDNDPLAFPSALLHRWRTSAEARAFGAIGKPFSDAAPQGRPLSAEEIDLLIASAADGELFVHSAEQLGTWVCAGKTHYQAQSDPAYARLFLDALKGLERRGLAAREDGNLFSLTSQGFQIARTMRERQAEMPMAPVPVQEPRFGEIVQVEPICPSHAQTGGFMIENVSVNCYSVRKLSSSQTVVFPRAAVCRVEHLGPEPSRIVVQGRLQWMTLMRRWEYRSEPPTHEFGRARRLFATLVANPDLRRLSEQAQCSGVQLAWTEAGNAHSEIDCPGEVIVFNDGHFVVSQDGRILVRGPTR